jgi:hypothetical protein
MEAIYFPETSFDSMKHLAYIHQINFLLSVSYEHNNTSNNRFNGVSYFLSCKWNEHFWVLVERRMTWKINDVLAEAGFFVTAHQATHLIDLSINCQNTIRSLLFCPHVSMLRRNILIELCFLLLFFTLTTLYLKLLSRIISSWWIAGILDFVHRPKF